MASLEQIAPAFIEMAHSIVWASAATVDANGRPRSRVLHPIWEWDGTDLFGWVATVPSPVKKAHLAVHPQMSLNYWTTSHDTCSAECLVEWYLDDETRTAVWSRFANGPEPVGYDPRIIPEWIGRADFGPICCAAADPLPAEVDARHCHDQGRRRTPWLDRCVR